MGVVNIDSNEAEALAAWHTGRASALRRQIQNAGELGLQSEPMFRERAAEATAHEKTAAALRNGIAREHFKQADAAWLNEVAWYLANPDSGPNEDAPD